MHQRVERRHPERAVGQRANDRERDIDDRDARRDLGRAGQDLAHCVEGLGSEDLHAADAQFRQEHHGHDDDPDAAEPLQQRHATG
jgi:hypothetical protein